MADAGNDARPCWFVGTNHYGNSDQTSRFLSEGVWDHAFEDNHRDHQRALKQVRSMRPGDRIALKSTYNRKHDLGFDNSGNSAAVMAIKAIGTISANFGGGKQVIVNWTEKYDLHREWYFYIYPKTIWRVLHGQKWEADELIAFAFEGRGQDLERFRNAPYWKDRFGTQVNEIRFGWTPFYEAVAEKLLAYQSNRTPLIQGIHEIAERTDAVGNLQDIFPGDVAGPLADICPFTVMAIFNRKVTHKNRKILATRIAEFLGVEISAPDHYEGISHLNPQKSWFFPYAHERAADDIERLWCVFAAGATLIDSDRPEDREEFVRSYDAAMKVKHVGWNLSTGLHWAHPWNFPTLDSPSRKYVETELGLQIPQNAPKGRCDAEAYLNLIDNLLTHFRGPDPQIESFPELSLESGKSMISSAEKDDEESDGKLEVHEINVTPQPYSVGGIINDGCFLSEEEIKRLLKCLRTKKNLILQGPPGTGKTWLAKRLAYALMGEKNPHNVRAVQFHPNLSYEDFVRGWRPSGDGKLKLTDGAFMQMVETALGDPDSKFVVVIEEINRGNPAQIFGELLTLLEADKRNPDDALELSYSGPDGKNGPVYIPENLYVIGTMNLADRSLALVDFALRRRFAFVTLKPQFTDAWQTWIVENRGIDGAYANTMRAHMESLNQEIAGDAKLGLQFCIGHSYLTPAESVGVDETRAWFRQVVETEIFPLLEEYWFDNSDKAQQERDKLLEGL